MINYSSKYHFFVLLKNSTHCTMFYFFIYMSHQLTYICVKSTAIFA